MRGLDVLEELVDGGKAINAAARAARANDVFIVERLGKEKVSATGKVETYEQLVAYIVRILGLAAPIAAQAIDPKKVVPEDAGHWLHLSDQQPTGRLGWEVYRGYDERLWLYQGESGRLVQQRRYPGIPRLIKDSTYEPSGRMRSDEAWETNSGRRVEFGPFDVTDEAMPYIRYCGAAAAAKAFFALCDRANVLDVVREGVAQQLTDAEPGEAETVK